MVSFDEVLNFIIPPAVIIFFLSLMYKGLKEPIDKFVGWVKGLFIKPDKDDFSRFRPGGFDPWLNDTGTYVPERY